MSRSCGSTSLLLTAVEHFTHKQTTSDFPILLCMDIQVGILTKLTIMVLRIMSQ